MCSFANNLFQKYLVLLRSMTLRRHSLLQFSFKSLYPFKVNNMNISNLNNYLLLKNKSNKSFIFIIFIYSASASFFLSSLWNSNCVRETFLCLQYSNDRQFIPSSFDEIDVQICTKNDKNDERKVLYTTVFHFMNGYDNHKYYLLKKSYITIVITHFLF